MRNSIRLVSAAIFASSMMLAQQPRGSEGLPRALELYRSGDCRAAEVIFNDLLRKEPRNLTIRKMLADCLTQDRRPEEARQEYQRILRLAPGDIDATRALQPAPQPS